MITDFITFITGWYNIPFTALLLLGMFLAILQLVGLGGDHEGDTNADLNHDVAIDHDVDLSHDVDLDHDLDLGHDVDLDHEVDLQHDVDLAHDADVDHDADLDHAADHDADAGHDGGSGLALLAFLGVGKAPLLIVLLLLMLMVGMAGWVFNAIVFSILGWYPGAIFTLILPAAVVVGAGISSRVTRAIGQALPPISTTATRAEALVGMRGTVISPFVDEKYGQVHVRNLDGTLITVFAINDSAEVIKRGEKVLLVSYDTAKRQYLVAPTLGE